MIVIPFRWGMCQHFIKGCKDVCGLYKVSVINVAPSVDYRNLQAALLEYNTLLEFNVYEERIGGKKGEICSNVP